MNILKKFEDNIWIIFEISGDRKRLDIVDDDYIMDISKKELKDFMDKLQLIYYDMRD